MKTLKNGNLEKLLFIWVGCLTVVVIGVSVIANFGLGVKLIKAEVAEHFVPSENEGVTPSGANPRSLTPVPVDSGPNAATLEKTYNRIARTISKVTVGISGANPQPNGPDVTVGSGFLVAPQHVLTNLHVVTSAQVPCVILYDPVRETYPAVLVHQDPANDLALLKIQTDKIFPFARLGNSELVDVGDIVFSVGSALGFSNTVTAGMVSSNRRSFSAGGKLFSDMLQTNTDIHPGSSGGPLVNISGEVVGVNTAVYSPNGAFTGIGFATPINRANNLMSQAGLSSTPNAQLAASGCFVAPNVPACTLAAGGVTSPAPVPLPPQGVDALNTAVRCPTCGTCQFVNQSLRCPTCRKRMVTDPSGMSFACPAGHVSGAIYNVMCAGCGTSYSVNPYSLAA